MSATIFLADDHQLVRAGIRSLIEKLPEFAVIGESSDGREAVKLVKSLQPDIVLMDIAMGGLNGLEATAKILKYQPQIKIIILSMHASEEYVLKALRAGASGYMLKDSAPQELEMAITSVLRNNIYLSPGVSNHVVSNVLKRNDGPQSSLDLLSSRQREILQLVAEGYSTKDIADKTNLSIKTVETHRMQLMNRLDIHGIAGLVRFAIRHGLIDSEK